MTPGTNGRLALCWQMLLAPLGVASEVIDREFASLVKWYRLDGRYYHTLEHIAAVLDVLDGLIHLAREPAAVMLAAWYHDCIYESKRTDNEDRSASAAGAAMRAMGLHQLIPAVTRMILATRDHQMQAPDDALLLDADLAILGASPDVYDRYSANIRREYAWVSEADYRVGRARVLDSFLTRPAIYQTEIMAARLHHAARANLSRERALLQDP